MNKDNCDDSGSTKKTNPAYPKSQFFQKRNSTFINSTAKLSGLKSLNSDNESDEESFDPNMLKFIADDKHKLGQILRDDNLNGEPNLATKKRSFERHIRRISTPLTIGGTFNHGSNEPNVKTPEHATVTQLAKELGKIKKYRSTKRSRLVSYTHLLWRKVKSSRSLT